MTKKHRLVKHIEHLAKIHDNGKTSMHDKRKMGHCYNIFPTA